MSTDTTTTRPKPKPINIKLPPCPHCGVELVVGAWYDRHTVELLFRSGDVYVRSHESARAQKVTP